MGKSKGRIKQIFIIINFILFAGLLFLSYETYNKYQKNKLAKDEIVANYKEMTNDKEIDDQKIK